MRNHVTLLGTIAAAIVIGTTGVGGAGFTPAERCQKGKNQLAGNYAACRQKAEGSLALTGDMATYTSALGRCATSFGDRWERIEAKTEALPGWTCPSVDDAAAIQSRVDAHTTNVATALAGGPLVDCPAALAACGADLQACLGATCPPDGTRIATGQTQCYDATGAPTACAGTGQDGELQKGHARTYVDNGDGTITDALTGLTWEQLTDDGSIHDWDDRYAFDDAMSGKIPALNTPPCFAGHCDWRIPNVSELQTLLDYGMPVGATAISPPFNTSCVAGCDGTACGCTPADVTLTSTVYPQPGSNLAYMWIVWFHNFTTIQGGYLGIEAVARAVRGGT
jgi:hypothetical protein